MAKFESTKIIELGSTAFRQPDADSHCRFIHGYKLTAKFWFACDALDGNNWVVDFGGLKELKDELRNLFDHTLCVSGDDPYLATFQQMYIDEIVDLRVFDNGVSIEKFAERCYLIANHYLRTLGDRCWCSKVEVFEHSSNSAIYSD